MSGLVEDEASEMVKFFRKKLQSKDHIIPMRDAFGVYVLNTLWSMLAGIRYRYVSDFYVRQFRRTEHSFNLFVFLALKIWNSRNYKIYLRNSSQTSIWLDVHSVSSQFCVTLLRNLPDTHSSWTFTRKFGLS